jgi:[ribosomal protein S5]-alanine N-acetyltransferase
MDRPIATDRLLLRPFAADDLGALHAMWADPEVGRWVGGTHTALRESEEELAAHLRHAAAHGFGFWAVVEPATGELLGEAGLMLLEGRGPDVEIGWCFARHAWGRGYATEAARAWLDAGFGTLGLERVVAVVLPDNARSRRVCDRLGMREEGTRDAYGAEHVLYALSAGPGTRR